MVPRQDDRPDGCLIGQTLDDSDVAVHLVVRVIHLNLEATLLAEKLSAAGDLHALLERQIRHDDLDDPRRPIRLSDEKPLTWPAFDEAFADELVGRPSDRDP